MLKLSKWFLFAVLISIFLIAYATPMERFKQWRGTNTSESMYGYTEEKPSYTDDYEDDFYIDGGKSLAERKGIQGTTITFIHFNDLHANLVPHLDVIPNAPLGETAKTTKIEERGGLARTATLIKQIRADAKYSILMNIGDTYHGGVEALYTNGNAIVAPVNALNIDIGVPGNWDFAYGPMVFRKRYTNSPMARMPGGMFGKVERPNFINLAANVKQTMPFPKDPILPATHIIEKGGVKVGFIGITSDIVDLMHKMMAAGMEFLHGEENYKALIEKYAKQLKAEGADIVVVMSELGVHKDYRLAQIIKAGSVDIFFSAHTHEATFKPLTSKSGAIVVEAGNDGYLGRMDVTVYKGKIINKQWELLAVTKNIPEDKTVKNLVNAARKPFLQKNVKMDMPMPMMDQTLTQPIDTVIGTTQGTLHRRDALENHFNVAFTRALRDYAKTDIAISPGFRFDAVIPGAEEFNDRLVGAGKITLEDVYRFFPVSYTLSTATIKVADLKEVLETALTRVFSDHAFSQQGGWFEGVYGIKLALDMSRPDGDYILNIKDLDTNKYLSSNKTLTVAGCTRPMDADDVICSHSGFSNVKPLKNPKTGKTWTVIDFFVDEVAKNPIKPTNTSHIKAINMSKTWPQDIFVQPLPSN